MDNIQVFPNKDFGNIRVIIIENEPWFVGKDIATALGYARPDNAVTDKVDEDDRMFLDKKLVLELGISFDYKELGQRGGWIVNESGMYALIFDSKLQNAKKFKKWVTSEVLPSIRKTGTFGQPQIPHTTDGKIALLAQGHQELREDINNIKHDIESLKMDLPVLPIEAERITNAVKSKGVHVMGGKQSNAYKNRSICNTVYRDIYGQIYRNFQINTYKALKRSQCDRAIEVVNKYELPVLLKDRIDAENAQQSLNLEGGAL